MRLPGASAAAAAALSLLCFLLLLLLWGGGPASLLLLGLGLVVAAVAVCRSPPRLLGLGLGPVGEKAVLVTGCDKGFGHALARHLHAKGFTVFAGCLLKDRGGEGARELARLGSKRLCVLQLDVCRQEEVDRALRFVQENLKDPGQGLWGLVNNAGVASFGDVEFTSLERYQQVAEVNLWGSRW